LFIEKELTSLVEFANSATRLRVFTGVSMLC